MLTYEQREAFDECGFVRISGAFTPEQAAAMEEQVWSVLARKSGVEREDSSTWVAGPVHRLQHLRGRAAFKAIGGDVTRAVLDDLLGPDQWETPKHWGQFLVSFPEAGRVWNVPTGWHSDHSFRKPTETLFGAMLFSFMADVAPRSGGTTVMAGSHRVVRRFAETHPSEILAKNRECRLAFEHSDPWLSALVSDEEDPNRVERFMEKEHDLGGITVRVTELTGQPGDIIFGHPWLLHAGALNCGVHPKFMLVQRISSK